MSAHVEGKLQVGQPCTYLWFGGKHGRPMLKESFIKSCTYSWFRGNMSAQVEGKPQTVQPCIYLWFGGKTWVAAHVEGKFQVG
jgi:hypothetical protein